jgi:WD40 repeat protein
MYDYVSTVSPDIDVTLSVTPQGIIVEEGGKNMEVHKFRGGAEEVIILSEQSVFFISLQWNALSAADSGTIFDIYHDPAKADGIAKSFKWAHPTDGHTYVVKFREPLRRFKQNAAIYGFYTLKLKVLGKIEDVVSMVLVGDSSGTMPDRVVTYDLSGTLLDTYTDILPAHPDSETNAIMDLVKTGNYLYCINYAQFGIYKLDLSCTYVSTLAIIEGSYSACGIATDGTYLYVAVSNETVRKYDLAGNLQDTWSGDSYYDCSVGPDGNIYILDTERGDGYAWVVVRDAAGNVLDQWSTGRHQAYGITVDSAGNVWIASYYDGYVQKFTSAGVLIDEWDICSALEMSPMDIGFDANGNVYLVLENWGSGDYYYLAKYNSSMVYVNHWTAMQHEDMYPQKLCVVDE